MSNINDFLSQNKIDSHSIKELKKSGNAQKMIDNLNDSQKQQLNEILNDKEKLENILKSPQAAAIMKMFGGGKNG